MPIRRNRFFGVASSQMLIEWVFMAARVSGLQNAPPPVDRITAGPCRCFKMVLRSISLNFASPFSSKISRMRRPASSSIRLSLSIKGRSRATARRLPRRISLIPLARQERLFCLFSADNPHQYLLRTGGVVQGVKFNIFCLGLALLIDR